MAARHMRTSSITKSSSSSSSSQHSRTASTSSEILITDTVTSLQRCVFGNVFRSQRQLARFIIFMILFILVIYMLGPFSGSSSRHLNTDGKPKASTSVRSLGSAAAAGDVAEAEPNSEYRATFFEEMGKKFAGREWQVKSDSFHSSNRLDADPDLLDAEGSKSSEVKVTSELGAVAERVREAARVLSECKGIPGLSVVLVKGDQGVQMTQGLADAQTRRPVTRDTKFLMGSVSKTVLGQLLAVLMAQSGKNLTWETRVRDILGQDLQLSTEELTREVTLADLMSHRSGLSSGNLAVRATLPRSMTRKELVRNLKHLPQSASFRKSFLYSNMATTLVAHVAETLGGAPWERLMVDKLLAPLGMLSSRPITSAQELDGDSFSKLYVSVEGTVRKADTQIFDLGPMAPAGLLSTTATDVTKWLQFNLRRGKLPDGRELIPAALWNPMWSKQAELSPRFLKGAEKSNGKTVGGGGGGEKGGNWPVEDVSEGYGLYWFRNKYRGLANLWHGGALYSHHTLAWHFPERQVALYAVINGHAGDSGRPLATVESLLYHAADLLLGFKPWLQIKSMCAYPEPFVGSSSKSNANHNNNNNNKDTSFFRMSDEVVSSQERKVRDFSNQEAKAVQYAEEGRGDDAGERGVRERRSSTEEREKGDNNNNLLLQSEKEIMVRDGNNGGGSATKLNLGIFAANRAAAAVERFEESRERIRKKNEGEEEEERFPSESYHGTYHNPLFGNFSVFQNPNPSGKLACRLNILNGDLTQREEGQHSHHRFGLVYTGSHRFLSKPTAAGTAKESLTLTFVERGQGQGQTTTITGEITALEVSSEWEEEVAVRFVRVR